MASPNFEPTVRHCRQYIFPFSWYGGISTWPELEKLLIAFNSEFLAMIQTHTSMFRLAENPVCEASICKGFLVQEVKLLGKRHIRFMTLLSCFTTLFNSLGHQRRFLLRARKVRQILLRGSNFGLRFFYVP